MVDASSHKVIQDLRNSLAWLDLALASLNEGVLVLNSSMEILFANDAISRMAGNNRIFLLGKFVWDAITLEQAGKPLAKTVFLDVLQQGGGQSLSGIYDLRTKSKVISIELTVEHIATSKQTVLVIRDVTERLQSQAQRIRIAQEQAAREAAERSQWRLLLQYKVASALAESPGLEDAILQILEVVCKNLDWQIGGLWVLDKSDNKLHCLQMWHAPKSPFGKFIEQSRQLTFKEGRGMPGTVWRLNEPVWLPDVTKVKNFPRIKTASTYGLHGAFAFPLSTGKEFLGVMEFFSTRVEEPNNDLLTDMATIGIQIAQFMRRKQIENALVQSEERLRFMADSMPQKIFTATPSGEVDYLNPEWFEYTGLPFDKLKGMGWEVIVHPDDVDENIRQWQQSVATGQPFQIEHRFKRADGTYRWHISRARPLRDSKGQIMMWTGSNTDIEDLRRKLELEEVTTTLREQRAQLIAVNNAKDDFISLASHQLRTPATGVKQFLAMLSDGYAGKLTKRQLSFVQKAYESNERQITIINDLLRVARVDAGKVTLQKEKTDLVRLIAGVLDEQTAKFAERGQKAVFNHSQDTLTATVDKNRFRMALENIIDNAGKYTHHGKTIKVTLTKTGRTISVAVKDSGVGISRKDQEKIFNKFTRIDNPLSISVGGTGLGLYWSRKIIELHGGEITVRSRPSKGSTFTIVLK